MLRTVQTALGRVEGTSEEDPAVTVFRGIPYAQPPVGELRWRAPRPCAPAANSPTKPPIACAGRDAHRPRCAPVAMCAGRHVRVQYPSDCAVRRAAA